MPVWTALSEPFQSIYHHSWILDFILHPLPRVLFKVGLWMLPGIRTYPSGAQHRDCPKKIHHLNFTIMFLVSVTASHKWGGGQAAIASTPHAGGAANLFKWRFKCQKATEAADTVKSPPRCLAFYTTTVYSPFTRDLWPSPLLIRPKQSLQLHFWMPVGIYWLPTLLKMMVWKQLWIEGRTGEGILAVLVRICTDHLPIKQQFPCFHGLIFFQFFFFLKSI